SQVALLHPRPLDGCPLPDHRSPNSSHAIVILALDPESEPDPGVPSIAPLTPPNLAHQLRGKTDETALTVLGPFVQALAAVELNPDTDHLQCQIEWLNRWGKSS